MNAWRPLCDWPEDGFINPSEDADDNHRRPGVEQEDFLVGFAAPHQPGEKANPEDDCGTHLVNIVVAY